MSYYVLEIYVIINSINGKLYVGQTIQSIEQRWRGHLASARSTDGALARAIRKYGEGALEMMELETCETQGHANRAEISWIAKLDTLVPRGYNLSVGGGNACKDVKTLLMTDVPTILRYLAWLNKPGNFSDSVVIAVPQP